MIRFCAALLVASTLAAPAPRADAIIVGVGLEIKIENGYPVVQSLIAGGPAAKDGSLRPGDRIEGVAQGDEAWQTTRGLKLAEVAAKIRGKLGSKVSVRATRPDSDEDGSRQQVIVELTRDALKSVPKK